MQRITLPPLRREHLQALVVDAFGAGHPRAVDPVIPMIASGRSPHVLFRPEEMLLLVGSPGERRRRAAAALSAKRTAGEDTGAPLRLLLCCACELGGKLGDDSFEVRERAEKRILERHFSELIAKHIQWHPFSDSAR